MLLGAAVGYAALGRHVNHIGDEGFHAPQIYSLFAGSFHRLPTTTMFPTYHFVLAMLERAFGYHDLSLMRLCNLVGSLVLPVLVWRIVAISSPRDAAQRTVQWFFMPLLFPFFFLVYTDAWALAVMLTQMLCVIERRVILAAIAGLIATSLRQDMIIWTGLAWAVAAFEDLNPRGWIRDIINSAWPRFVAAVPLFLVLALFSAFYVWNGGVAVGDQAQHQIELNPTNLFYFLLCGWVIFLPLNLEALPRILVLLRRPVSWVLIGLGLLAYLGTYASTHPYNSLNFYLHNKGLYLLTKYLWIRVLAYLPMAWMVLTACVTRFTDPRFYLLYPVAILSVAFHPLIEQRYYLPALTLFHVWRPATDRVWEYSILGLYLLESAVIVWGIDAERFFL